MSNQEIQMYMNRKIFSLALLAVLSMPTTSKAQTYNATTDFSLTGNPNGLWTYGFTSTLGGTFTLFDTTISGPLYDGWKHSVVLDSGTVPLIAKNTTGSTLFGIPANFLFLHPGANTLAVLRFTAPTTTNYIVNTQFFSGDSGETSAFILHNGTTLFSHSTTSDNPDFNTNLTLVAGDTLDLVVDRGSDNYFSDSTPVTMTLHQVPLSITPEAPSLLQFLPGLFPLGILLAKRRNRLN